MTSKAKWWIVRALSWRQTLGVGGARSVVGGVNFRPGSTGQGDDWAVREEGLMRKHGLACTRGWTSPPVCADSWHYGSWKENSCKQMTRKHLKFEFKHICRWNVEIWLSVCGYVCPYMTGFVFVPRHDKSLSIKISASCLHGGISCAVAHTYGCVLFCRCLQQWEDTLRSISSILNGLDILCRYLKWPTAAFLPK